MRCKGHGEGKGAGARSRGRKQGRKQLSEPEQSSRGSGDETTRQGEEEAACEAGLGYLNSQTPRVIWGEKQASARGGGILLVPLGIRPFLAPGNNLDSDAASPFAPRNRGGPLR